MKKIFVLALGLISLTAAAQESANSRPLPESGLITLEAFVAGIRLQNESIKSAKNINVMVNDLLIEDWAGYKIDPKNVSKMEILILEPKEPNQKKTSPSIIITTKRK